MVLNSSVGLGQDDIALLSYVKEEEMEKWEEKELSYKNHHTEILFRLMVLIQMKA